MEQRRKNGLIAMGVGLVVAVVGELVSPWWAVTAVVAVVATACLIGGGVAVALTYREEAGRAPAARLSLVAAGAGLKPRGRSRGRREAGAVDTGAVTAYAARFNDELARCEELLVGRADGEADRGAEGGGAEGGGGESRADGRAVTTTFDLEAARERLMTFVANPLYGEATRRSLVDEARVRDISVKLATVL